jgi:hypothetical protein
MLRSGDGFATDFPIGLFRVSDSALLTSGTIHAGTIDSLVDDFRYVDAPDVTLAPGTRYVVSFFSAGDAFGDVMFGEAGTPATVSVDSALTYVQARWDWPEAGFGLPENLTAWRIGPNFLFREATPALPVPGALLLAGLGASLAIRLRR